MTQRKGEKKVLSNAELARRFAGLSTPLLADASLRLGVELRLAPPTVRPVERGIPWPAAPFRCGTTGVWTSSSRRSEAEREATSS